ncbi:MAG: dynamin family protein [Lachnospiraceae bacterium]|nr:dynamin family protein [Lachnospiraceae bacterium]
MLFEEEDEVSLDELIEDIQIDNENIYISDSGKAIELIAQLVHNESNPKGNGLVQVKEKIKDLFQLMNDCDIPDMFEQQRKFEVLLERLSEWGTAGILRGKHVVSLGGRFSSGKSQFINAVTGMEDTLPVDQNPTTSVSSYIVHADVDEIEVNTKFGYSAKLSKEAMRALSHEFYNKYSIGFSSVLENIIIRTKKYEIDDSIVLLDTPGYSKADVDDNVRERTSDRQKAHDKLAITDYLIWLVDVTKGTITSEDLDFIRGLRLNNKILVVFTKADKRTPEAVQEVVRLAKETIWNAGIDCYAVTAYSSFEKKEYGENNIETFFSEVVRNKVSENDIIEQISILSADIQKMIVNEKKLSKRREKRYFEVLSDTKNITSVESIAKLWKYENIRLMKIDRVSDMFKKLVEELHQIINVQ